MSMASAVVRAYTFNSVLTSSHPIDATRVALLAVLRIAACAPLCLNTYTGLFGPVPFIRSFGITPLLVHAIVLVVMCPVNFAQGYVIITQCRCKLALQCNDTGITANVVSTECCTVLHTLDYLNDLGMYCHLVKGTICLGLV